MRSPIVRYVAEMPSRLPDLPSDGPSSDVTGCPADEVPHLRRHRANLGTAPDSTRGYTTPRDTTHFAALRDPREGWRVPCPSQEILLVVLCGTDDFVEAKVWGEERLDFSRRFLPVERGIPSHNAPDDVMNGIDTELFKLCFSDGVDELRDGQPDIIAIDRKASRRCHDRARGRGPLHLVSAGASRQRLALGQQACAAKSDEITAIPLLLERLESAGALVTVDAMGTQTASPTPSCGGAQTIC